MIGWRKVITRWEDDPVRRHLRRCWRGFRGRRGMPPPEGYKAAGREGGAGQV